MELPRIGQPKGKNARKYPILGMTEKENNIVKDLLYKRDMPHIAKFLETDQTKLISYKLSTSRTVLPPLSSSKSAKQPQTDPQDLFNQTVSKQFRKNSENCIFTIINDIFYKIELSNDYMTDPLLNEVFMMQFLNHFDKKSISII